MTLPNNLTHRAGTPAAAWFAAQSFHGSSAQRPASSTPTPPAHVDARPRRDYMLPSGDLVTLILDHDETPAQSRTVALKGGRIVTAILAPIQRREIEALLAYAVEHDDQRLRYLCRDALGDVRGEPLTSAERRAVVRACASELQMVRAMGVGGAL